MAKKIIYKQENGTLSIITPVENDLMTIEEIAQKDVPTGLPYKIIEDTDLPSLREFRNAWTIDDSELTDGVGE
jgi:hypothetical protein